MACDVAVTSLIRWARYGALATLTAGLLLHPGSSGEAKAKHRSAPAKTAESRTKHAAIVIDADSGAVLHQEAADEPRYPASLTKMMTLVMMFDALDRGRFRVDSRLAVSAHAAAQPATKLGLEPGDTISVREAILGLVTKSANDAAMVVAEAIGGSEERFAAMMMQRARRLGMSSTTFQNPHGLPDPDQVTTARDLATLARALVQQYPHHYGYFSTSSFTYYGVTHANHNRLMNWYEGADGIKTGYIRASGFNLAASAVRDGRRLIGVVLGGTSPGARDQQMGRLLDRAFASADDLGTVIHASAETPAERPAAQQQTKLAAVAPAPARAPSALPRVTAERWAIQVGAFNKADLARRAAEQAKAKGPAALRATVIDMSQTAGKRNQVYRARLIGLDRAEAREACRILKQRRLTCTEVSPADLGPVRLATHH